MTTWKPTHRVTSTVAGETRTDELMLVDGALYSESEWGADTSASWELVDGEYLFQGQVPTGPYAVDRLRCRP